MDHPTADSSEHSDDFLALTAAVAWPRGPFRSHYGRLPHLGDGQPLPRALQLARKAGALLLQVAQARSGLLKVAPRELVLDAGFAKDLEPGAQPLDLRRALDQLGLKSSGLLRQARSTA